MEYSIFATLPEPLCGELSSLIKELSIKYNGPIFKAHLTILGRVNRDLEEIHNALTKIADHNLALELSLGPVSFSTTYFQSVFVRVNSTAQLMKLNLDIKRLLKMDNNVFMPHISLFYGDHDMQTREKIAKKLKFRDTKFVSNRLEIVPINPKVSAWDPIMTFELNK